MAYTMVEMAKANKVSPYHYLTFLFEHQPNETMSDDELEQLAPWNENVKAEIQRLRYKNKKSQEPVKNNASWTFLRFLYISKSMIYLQPFWDKFCEGRAM